MQMTNLYALFIKMDCAQVEINPLVVNPEGHGKLLQHIMYMPY